jgi:hypothetical protein
MKGLFKDFVRGVVVSAATMTGIAIVGYVYDKIEDRKYRKQLKKDKAKAIKEQKYD